MSATYTVQLARVTPAVITALVAKSDGTIYGVTLSRALCTCSCPHSMFRGASCKHQAAVVQDLEYARNAASRTDKAECSDQSEAALEAAASAWARAAAWVALASLDTKQAA